MFQQNPQVGNLVATDVAPYAEADEGASATSSPPSDRRRSRPREDFADLPSRTDLLVSVNLSVPILGERWRSFLLSASPPAVIWNGYVALRQAGIGHEKSFARC
jgi:hypothetical protein